MTTDTQPDERIAQVLEALTLGQEPPFALTKEEAQSLISGIPIVLGGGRLQKRNSTLCVMQLANVYDAALSGTAVKGARAPSSYRPSRMAFSPAYTDIDQVCPVVEQFMIGLNDFLLKGTHSRLLPYIPKLLNTRVTEKTSRRGVILRTVGAEAMRWDAMHGGDLWGVAEELTLENEWDEGDPEEILKALRKMGKAKVLKELRDNLDEDFPYGAYWRWKGGGDKSNKDKGYDALFKLLDRLLRAR